MARTVTAAFTIAVAMAGGTLGQNSSAVGEPHKYLRMVAQFSESELASLDRGEPLAKVLDTDKREVAVVGAVHINGPRERLFERYRDVSSLKANHLVMEVGRFSTPPTPADLDPLNFENYDLETIRSCKPGDCGVRLSTENMDRFAREVNWRAPDWRQRAQGLWRQLLAKDAAAYLDSGKLGDYRNKTEPLNVADEFAILFQESTYFEPISPQFFWYLKTFPQARLDGVENILYWSKDDIYRPVTRMTHLVLYPPAPDAQRPGIVATKQFYATHYFDAGLGFTFTFNDRASGFYMLSVTRVRTRSLTSVMRLMVRAIVQRRSREAMEAILRSTKTGLENK
jgi:hypothetical protein